MKGFLALVAASAALMTAYSARADGLATIAAALPAESRTALEYEVSEQRAASPDGSAPPRGDRGPRRVPAPRERAEARVDARRRDGRPVGRRAREGARRGRLELGMEGDGPGRRERRRRGARAGGEGARPRVHGANR